MKPGAIAIGISVGGCLLAILTGLLGKWIDYDMSKAAFAVFAGTQVTAFVLGFQNRRDRLGRAASIMSSILLIASLLLLA
ncbi:MAG: hypothetical protein ABFD69_05325 [Candidatus Sumerlaeia bacterium]